MRYELTDFEWAAIRSFLPNKPRGVPRVDDRRVLNGIFWVLRSGAPWRDLRSERADQHAAAEVEAQTRLLHDTADLIAPVITEVSMMSAVVQGEAKGLPRTRIDERSDGRFEPLFAQARKETDEAARILADDGDGVAADLARERAVTARVRHRVARQAIARAILVPLTGPGAEVVRQEQHVLDEVDVELCVVDLDGASRDPVAEGVRRAPKARLALVAATAQVLHNGLAVLGVSAPQKM